MQNKDCVNITFPSFSENETLARSFAAAYAARFDPTLRELDDIKTAVSEAVTNAVVHAYPNEPGQVMPEITDEYAESVSDRYIELYEHITGEKFDKAAETGDIAARIERNVAEWLAAYKK